MFAPVAVELESDKWPIQAVFWLEWGCSHITDLLWRTT